MNWRDLVAREDELADEVHELVEQVHVDADRRVRHRGVAFGLLARVALRRDLLVCRVQRSDRLDVDRLAVSCTSSDAVAVSFAAPRRGSDAPPRRTASGISCSSLRRATSSA